MVVRGQSQIAVKVGVANAVLAHLAERSPNQRASNSYLLETMSID